LIPFCLLHKTEHIFNMQLREDTIRARFLKQVKTKKKRVRFHPQPEYIFYNGVNSYVDTNAFV